MRAQEEGRKKKKKNRSPSVLSIFSAPAWRTLESPPSARGRAQLSTAPMAHAHGEKREEKREEGRVLARRRVECKKEKKKVKQVLLAFSLFSLPRFFFFFFGQRSPSFQTRPCTLRTPKEKNTPPAAGERRGGLQNSFVCDSRERGRAAQGALSPFSFLLHAASRGLQLSLFSLSVPLFHILRSLFTISQFFSPPSSQLRIPLGLSRMIPSPRTNKKGIVLFDVLTISSYVSSSTSTTVAVSSTSPRTMLRCWS